ncbi:FAR1 DNA binding domain, FHY3/FAR1 family [Artemisia annua]|uniref:FAR1 DNA binding domain, FHY3/FAR1 family n=1 Tax=Artemisia annua TaxID=35608 RepID=A0A2U1KFC3_ARTAN|nr:FAR1 DNA binding domain, FHY3/FAR1 family [Artemisia annua]
MALKFYKDYARQGEKRRKRASQRCGCQARLRIRRTPENKWVVYKFLEKHNHRLVREEDYMYLKVACKLSFPQQQLLYHLSNANLGPTRAWNVFKEMCGGFENIGVTDVECRNYKHDKTLIGLFWADDQAKQYYATFGDVVSFDATFRSNSVQESATFSTFVIRDTGADYKIKKKTIEVIHEVKYTPSDCSVQCSCLRYECYGLLCSHIFYVLRMRKVDHFPMQYLQSRWSKNALIIKPVEKSKDGGTLSKSGCVLDSVLREIYKDVEQSVNHLVGDFEKLQLYKDAQTSLKEKAITDVPNPPKMNTNAVYSATLGVNEPAETDILPPSGINTKGSRIRTRHKSKTEILSKLSDKPKRLCRTCGEYSYHDSRNCPTKKKGLKDDDVADVEYNKGEDMDFCYSD